MYSRFRPQAPVRPSGSDQRELIFIKEIAVLISRSATALMYLYSNAVLRHVGKTVDTQDASRSSATSVI
jgi:hypothetical protein